MEILDDGYWVPPISAEAAEDSTISLLLPVSVLHSEGADKLMMPVFTTRTDAEGIGLAIPPQYFRLTLLRELLPPGTLLVIHFGTDRQVAVGYDQWASKGMEDSPLEPVSSPPADSPNWLQLLAQREEVPRSGTHRDDEDLPNPSHPNWLELLAEREQRAIE